MTNQDGLIRAMNRLVVLRSDLIAIEADVRTYRSGLPKAVDAPVTSALQDEALAWKIALDRAESSLSYWIIDLQSEIDELQP